MNLREMSSFQRYHMKQALLRSLFLVVFLVGKAAIVWAGNSPEEMDLEGSDFKGALQGFSALQSTFDQFNASKKPCTDSIDHLFTIEEETDEQVRAEQAPRTAAEKFSTSKGIAEENISRLVRRYSRLLAAARKVGKSPDAQLAILTAVDRWVKDYNLVYARVRALQIRHERLVRKGLLRASETSHGVTRETRVEPWERMQGFHSYEQEKDRFIEYMRDYSKGPVS